MAKFPPDDDSLPSGAPAPRAEASADGNFKRGRFNPIIIILGLLVAGGGGYLIYRGIQHDAQEMKAEDRAKEMQNIFILPVEDQLPKWRTWAASEDEDMVQESLVQLAYLKDEECIPLATKALERNKPAINGVAAQVLAHFGSPKADGAKPALLKVLKTASDADKPQITWALVALREPSVFKDAMELYRQGKLVGVQRVGGGTAFDPELLASLVSLDELAEMAGDEHQAVRQLVATTIAAHAEPKYIDVLIKLVNDDQIEVAGQAANGLGKLPDPRARDPLLKKLSKLEELAAPPEAGAAKEVRDRFLSALRNGIGGEGLVLALDTVVKEPESTNWFQTEQIFKLIQALADPRAGDALDKWAKAGERHPHWKSEIGMRLAEIGDIRAVPYLAERMALDPEKLYPLEKFWQHGSGGHLSKTDNQRVWAARMLADLAMIHPDKKDQLLAAESPVFKWLTGKPQPHANGLRFLATVQSEESHKKLQDWAFTDEPLPKENHTDLQVPYKWATAQSALRYIGRYRKEEDYKNLEKYLDLKKDKKVDITQEGLMDGGKSMMGMVLRAAAYGAAQGIGEWGDPKGVKPLTKLIEDETWHEEARIAACEALAWCATPEDMKEIAAKAVKFNSDTSPKKLFIGACYTTTLSLRPMPEVSSDSVTLMTPEMAPAVRNAIAQAIGSSPLDKASADKLFEKMKVEDTRNAAALALILGGDVSTSSRAVALFGELPPQALVDMKDSYFRAFGFWSDEDFKRGNLYRWVENAEAMARVKIHGGPQMWAIERLQAQFENLEYDNGPHSETRVVLRQRLLTDAKGSDPKKRDHALQTLRFMKEQGVLMALMDEKGETGLIARKEFHELMHPTPIEGDEKLKSLKAEQAASMKKDKKD